ADAQRLQREGIVRSAVEDIGSQSRSDRRTGGDTTIIAGKIAKADLLRGREHTPNQTGHGGGPEINAGAADRGAINLTRTNVRRENAVKFSNGTDHNDDGFPAGTLQYASLNLLR